MDSKIYLTALLITLSTMGRCQQPITCKAGRFKAGQTASVTCNFHRSVKDIGHHVYVVHYPLDAPDDSLGNDIVSCFRSFDLKLICDAAKGVQMNSDVTNRLTFHIPEVTTDFAGRYACQLVPPDDTIIVFCSMTVEGTLIQNKTDEDDIAQPEISSRMIMSIAAISVGCLIGILFVILCYCLIRRRRRRWRYAKRNLVLYDSVNCQDPNFGQAYRNKDSVVNPQNNFKTDADNSHSDMHAPRHIDEFHSGNDTDGSSSYHSSPEDFEK